MRRGIPIIVLLVVALLGLMLSQSASGAYEPDRAYQIRPVGALDPMPTPAAGAMTVYSVINVDALPLDALHTFRDAQGVVVYQFQAAVPADTQNQYHVRDMAQIPSPFQGEVAISADRAFSAFVVGYDYPDAEGTPIVTETPTPVPSLTPSPTPVPATPTPTSGDLALGRPAVASSGASAALAVDGNATTYWESTAGGAQWLYVDLGSSLLVQSVRARWGAGYASYYYFETSADGITFGPFWTITSGSGDETVPLNRATRYIRVRATTLRAGYSVYQLASLEATGATVPTPTVNPPTFTPTPTVNPPTSTPTLTATPTVNPPTATTTPTPTSTSTPVPPTATRTATVTATSTPVPPTVTPTLTPTLTATPVPPTPTSTPLPHRPWDVNGDGIVSALDIAAVDAHWLETGTPGWIAADVMPDGRIDLSDLLVVVAHWREAY